MCSSDLDRGSGGSREERRRGRGCGAGDVNVIGGDDGGAAAGWPLVWAGGAQAKPGLQYPWQHQEYAGRAD